MKLKRIPKAYKKFVIQMKIVCKSLHWKFGRQTNLKERWDVVEGFAFTLDGVEYLIDFDETNSSETNAGYYASTVVTHHGNRERPPSEDELIISKMNTRMPEALLSAFVSTHSNVRISWILESIEDDQQAEYYEKMD